MLEWKKNGGKAGPSPQETFLGSITKCFLSLFFVILKAFHVSKGVSVTGTNGANDKETQGFANQQQQPH